MRTISKISVVTVLAMAMTSFAQTAPEKKDSKPGKQGTFTGMVSDSMCGAKHMMKGKSAAECTRACVKQGSDYALVVGKKVYTLKGNTSDLDKYAGERVTVKGMLSGSTINAETVTPAKATKIS